MAADQPELVAEKGQILSNELESNSTSSPGEYYDDLPDPDAGKSDEERARLVRPSTSSTVGVVY
jgi:hypothetical protein